MAKAGKAPNTLNFDTGVVEYVVNGGAHLRINPADINMAARFEALIGEVEAIIKGIGEEDRAQGAFAADRECKEKLAGVFPCGNDFDAIFDGVNIMSPTDSGASVLENFLEAITPIVEEYTGKRVETMQERAKQAAKEAAANREQRRAAK